MRCPKCGYTTISEFESCPKCEANLESVKAFDIHTAVKGGFWIRFAAFVIDFTIIYLTYRFFFVYIVGLAVNLGGFASNTSEEEVERLFNYISTFIWIFFILFYLTLFIELDGQTPGKKLLRLKVVNLTGGPVGYKKAFLRSIGYFVSFFLLGLGFIMIAVDRNKRGLHDLIAGTYVIKTISSE